MELIRIWLTLTCIPLVWSLWRYQGALLHNLWFFYSQFKFYFSFFILSWFSMLSDFDFQSSPILLYNSPNNTAFRCSLTADFDKEHLSKYCDENDVPGTCLYNNWIVSLLLNCINFTGHYNKTALNKSNFPAFLGREKILNIS